MELAILNKIGNKEEPENPDRESRDLVQRVIEGEEHAVKTFIETYKRFVISVIWSYVRNEEDLQDICQEVFIKACKGLKGFGFRSSLKTWLATISLNECRRHHRRNLFAKKQVSLDEEVMGNHYGRASPGHEERLFAASLLEKVNTVVERLPQDMRLIFRLRFIEEMDSSEIAKIVKKPAGTVRSRISELRSLIEKETRGGLT
jgi:RNA polymerase sigma-70 factor (ECF subfamily)